MDFDFRVARNKLMKTGKITKHTTTSNGRKYVRSKIYLYDASLINKGYEMYDLGYINIKEDRKALRSKGGAMFYYRWSAQMALS